MPSDTLPFEPLAKALGNVATEWGRTCPNQFWCGGRTRAQGLGFPTEYSSATSVAIRLGVSRRMALRWAKCGVPRSTIDGWLFPLGIHPSEVWGTDYYADVT